MIRNLDGWFDRHAGDAVRMPDAESGRYLLEVLWWRYAARETYYWQDPLSYATR